MEDTKEAWKTNCYCPTPEFKTSSGTCHLYVPPALPLLKPRKQLHVPKELKSRNSEIVKDSLTSTYNGDYPAKHWETNHVKFSAADHAQTVQYLTTLDKKFFRNPPKPFKHISEVKSNFTLKTLPQDNFRRELCPSRDSFCELKDLAKDHQPFVRPEEFNYVKYMDPYLTTNREYHYPFTTNQWTGIAKKDCLTIYDLVEPKIPKCLGFGARNPPNVGSLYPMDTSTMHDKIPFKHTQKLKTIPRNDTVILHQGKTTETMDQFKTPSESPLYYESLKKIKCHMKSPPANLTSLEILNTKRVYNPESKFYGSNCSTVGIIAPNSKKKFPNK